MSTTIAAVLAALITTGLTSAVSHEFTIVGGSMAAVLFAVSTVVQRNVTVYTTFLFGAICMVMIALVSSEVNTAPITNTVHVVSMYVALISLAFSSPDRSTFCPQFIMLTNLIVTTSVLYQGLNGELLKAWQISNPAGGPNIMAAHINMTLPLVLVLIHEATGLKKMALVVLSCLNCFAVVLIMSRNGIGTMLIILTLYVLFNHKRMAVVVSSTIIGICMSLDSVMQLPFVHNLLLRMRFVGYNATAPRTLIWRVAWDHISTHQLLGVGPGGPKRALAVIDTYHCHNNFVQVALETGIPSFAIFSLLVILLLLMPARAVLRGRSCFVFTLPILAYLSYSWTEMPLTFPGTTLLLAACVHEARLAVQRRDEPLPALKYPHLSSPPKRIAAAA
ncbi:MAG: O-antigen ligase family protein [Planctomycetaceae bacterium]|nr:O-antigen ligase family protein [Planctomycetaceae bacterium]